MTLTTAEGTSANSARVLVPCSSSSRRPPAEGAITANGSQSTDRDSRMKETSVKNGERVVNVPVFFHHEKAKEEFGRNLGGVV